MIILFIRKERTFPTGRPDIALQLTNDLIFPAHVIRSFLFLIIVALCFLCVNAENQKLPPLA